MNIYKQMRRSVKGNVLKSLSVEGFDVISAGAGITPESGIANGCNLMIAEKDNHLNSNDCFHLEFDDDHDISAFIKHLQNSRTLMREADGYFKEGDKVMDENGIKGEVASEPKTGVQMKHVEVLFDGESESLLIEAKYLKKL